MGGIPGALGTRAAATTDQIENHAFRRGFPTSLHITYNGCLRKHLAGAGPPNGPSVEVSKMPSAFGLLVFPANRWHVSTSRRAVVAEIVRTAEV
jgi:hypothetical protein